MELRRYLSVARHRLPLIVVIVLASLAGAYLITPRAPTYSASSTLYVGSQNLDLGQGYNAQAAGAGVPGFDRYIQTFSTMITDSTTAQQAANQAGVPRSASTIQAETKAAQVENTNLLKITVTDRDPAVAKKLATTVSQVFLDRANNLSAGRKSQNYLRVSQPADLPTAPNSRNLPRNLVLGGIVGLIVAGLVVSLLEYLDVTIRGPEDAERRLGLPVLGAIPALGDRLPGAAVLRVHQPGSPGGVRAERRPMGTRPARQP